MSSLRSFGAPRSPHTLHTISRSNRLSISKYGESRPVDHKKNAHGRIRQRVVSYATDYVPSPLDPSVQIAQLAVFAFIAAALPAAWWLIVVPTSRNKLSKDKRRGPLREFLEQVDIEGNDLTKWFFAKWLRQMPAREKARKRNLEAMGKTYNPPEEEPAYEVASEQKKSSAEKFLSGDNPIVVVMSILGIFVAIQVALHPR